MKISVPLFYFSYFGYEVILSRTRGVYIFYDTTCGSEVIVSIFIIVGYFSVWIYSVIYVMVITSVISDFLESKSHVTVSWNPSHISCLILYIKK